MKTLACKDLGVAGCEFVATGETAEEVVQKMSEHGAAAHPDKMSAASPEEMKATMTAAVKDAA